MVEETNKVKQEKDLVLTAISGYTWEQLEPFVISLERSGYQGLKAAVVYNLDYEVADKLVQHNWSLMVSGKPDDEKKQYGPFNFGNYAVISLRFLHYWLLLNNLDRDMYNNLRFIIAVDAKDVVFQFNPSDYLWDSLACAEINVGSEGLLYKDEPWGAQNMKDSFGPLVYEHMKDREIVNCGTLAGRAKVMHDLFFNIWLLCQTNKCHNPDQAALNVLLSTRPWKDLTSIQSHRAGWACQAGTVADPNKMEQFGPRLTENTPIPQITPKGGVVHYRDASLPPNYYKVFTLVHQYDRNPEWKKLIEAKYREGVEEYHDPIVEYKHP